MESNRRKQLEDYRTKLTIYESILDTVNDITGCSYGRKIYDCSDEDLETMKWSEKAEHQVYDAEGLQVYSEPYENPTEEYEYERNKTYQLAREAYKVVRTSLEKWLDK